MDNVRKLSYYYHKLKIAKIALDKQYRLSHADVDALFEIIDKMYVDCIQLDLNYDQDNV